MTRDELWWVGEKEWCGCCGKLLPPFPYVLSEPRWWCASCAWHVSHEAAKKQHERTYFARTGEDCPYAADFERA